MEYTNDFFKWLEKYHITEGDILACRKMQSMNIVEKENVYGISGVSVCGFQKNDLVQLGGEIKQKYSEPKKEYYERCYGIFLICARLMDAANEILLDEGSWGKGYFQEKFTKWLEESLAKCENK